MTEPKSDAVRRLLARLKDKERLVAGQKSEAREAVRELMHFTEGMDYLSRLHEPMKWSPLLIKDFLAYSKRAGLPLAETPAFRRLSMKFSNAENKPVRVSVVEFKSFMAKARTQLLDSLPGRENKIGPFFKKHPGFMKEFDIALQNASTDVMLSPDAEAHPIFRKHYEGAVDSFFGRKASALRQQRKLAEMRARAARRKR